jgi:glycosyltransferase involved in cell wall biosynthesis
VKTIRPLIITEQLRQSTPGGIGVYVKGLVRGLAELNVEPLLLSSAGPTLKDLFPGVIRSDIAATRLPSRMQQVAWTNGQPIARSLLSTVEIVHATSLLTPGKPRDVPLSLFIHDVCFLRSPESYPKRGLQWHMGALERARRRADIVLVPSDHVANDLNSFGVPTDRIHVTGEGSDHLPLITRQSDQGSFILSVGTLQPRKNLARLIEAYERIRMTLPHPVMLKIVGPPGWGSLGTSVAHEGVEWLGHVSDLELARLYSEAHMFAYVPIDEGFGLPVVEAQRAGVPVVASSSVPSAAQNPSAAVLVDYDDVTAISEALRQVAIDRPLRSRLVANGISAVSSQTWRNTAERHLEAWLTCR